MHERSARLRWEDFADAQLCASGRAREIVARPATGVSPWSPRRRIRRGGRVSRAAARVRWRGTAAPRRRCSGPRPARPRRGRVAGDPVRALRAARVRGGRALEGLPERVLRRAGLRVDTQPGRRPRRRRCVARRGRARGVRLGARARRRAGGARRRDAPSCSVSGCRAARIRAWPGGFAPRAARRTPPAQPRRARRILRLLWTGERAGVEVDAGGVASRHRASGSSRRMRCGSSAK